MVVEKRNDRGLVFRRIVVGHSDKHLTSSTSGADAQASVAGIASFGFFQQRRAQSGNPGPGGERRVVQIYLSPASRYIVSYREQAREAEVSL